MKICLLSIVLFFTFFSENTTAFAQNLFKLKGKITEQKTKESIPFANMFDSTYNIHATSDSTGNFEITLQEGIYQFEITSVGYQPVFKEIKLFKDTDLQ
ncbi:MAG: carboxypeptidase-like regulatory domain-containing protein, partial [Chitinophagales bacterium]|nr:carboxypeptidase-like regulatory domain-containing protein [Chitinophagales bacterium]